MPWPGPLALVREALRARRERQRDLRTLQSNLPYEGLGARRQPNRHFPGNSVQTTRYSLWSFVPVNLYEQFHRFANIYFVGLAALNFVPVVNAFEPEVALIPVCVILLLTALKDGWEDFRRYQADRKLNHTPCLIYSRRGSGFVERRWKDVRVGDFVQVSSNEIVPADLLLLHTADPRGTCHIETSNLDGETNLKQRKAVPGFSVANTAFQPQQFNSVVVCERPISNLNHFKGYVEGPDKKKLGIGIESLLLRGCTIRNTDHAVGFVVYTGHETKSMLNSNGPRYKRSTLERSVNVNVLYCGVLLFVMCLIGALGHFFWLKSIPSMPLYLVPDGSGHLDPPLLSSFYMFFTMIILLQVLIPISLYVSIELVKMGQIFFITNDIELYDEELDSRVQCRSLNITEDLGQIQYIFSDKTGTLTQNKMVFHRCTVMGTEYSHRENVIRLAALSEADSEEEVIFHQQTPPPHRTGWSLDDLGPDHRRHGTRHRNKVTGCAKAEAAFSSPLETEVVPDRKLLQRVLEDGGRGLASPEAGPYFDFLLALAICNTVVVSTATAQQPRAPGPPGQPSSSGPLGALTGLVGRLASLRRPLDSWLPMGGKPRPRTLSNVFTLEEDDAEDPDPTTTSTSKHAPSTSPRTMNGSAAHHCSLDTAGTDRDQEGCAPVLCPAGGLGPGLSYEAESPDEAALVHAARAYGFTLLGRTPDSVSVRLPRGQELTFQVLETLAFDSNRKRMSVLVRHPVTGEVVLYTKGADFAIMELLGTPYAENCLKDNHKDVAARTQKHLDCYAKEGLRTLCFAKKVLSERAYDAWWQARQEAAAAMDDREELLMEAAALLETNLTLLGATGIEDRLQESVPDTIVALREAGIQLWVLTGDKTETAVNIAYACGLLDEGDLVFNMSTTNKAMCASFLDCTLEEVRRSERHPWGSGVEGASSPTISLVTDGQTLSMAMESDLQDRFMELAARCHSVLCCRVTPLQKSAVVRLVRSKLGVMTLAIGDGANDVNMIQAADVGVGISGQEGMQAVMASDFAISRFKHMKKLLLVHGHCCYSTLANMVVYFFYKNVMYVNLLFWYQFYCGFSGASMVDYWLLIFFNLFFTSTPPIIFGVMDKDVSAETLMGLPELYRSGQQSQEFMRSTFWIALLDAFYQSLVCFFIPYWTYAGSDIDIFTFGTPLNTVALFTILLHLAIEIQTWTVVHGAIMLGSVLLYLVVTLLYSALCVSCNPPSDPYWIMEQQMSDPMFYLVCTITTVVALLPRFLFHVVRNTVSPSPIVRARHLDRLDPTTREQWIREWRELRGLWREPGNVSGLPPPPSPTLEHSRPPFSPLPPVAPDYDITGSDIILNAIIKSSPNPL